MKIKESRVGYRLLKPIQQSPHFIQLVEELNKSVEMEKQKRAEFIEQLDETKKVEFINGEIIIQTPARNKHIEVSDRLFFLIYLYLIKNRFGKVKHEKTLISLTRNDYEPDICFWKNEKATLFTPEQIRFPAPDFIVEVISNSTKKYDRGVKFEDYALHDVEEYWLVDPDTKSVEQYLLVGNQYQLENKKNQEGEIVSTVIQGLIISMAAIFSEEY